MQWFVENGHQREQNRQKSVRSAYLVTIRKSEIVRLHEKALCIVMVLLRSHLLADNFEAELFSIEDYYEIGSEYYLRSYICGHNDKLGGMVMAAIKEKKCYTVPEIQEILNISRPSVYNLLKKGEFHSVYVADQHRISNTET